jgi:hypothetical protein
MFFTFQLVCLTWIFFRSSSWADTVTIFKSFASRHWGMPFVDVVTMTYGGLALAILLAVEIIYKSKPNFNIEWRTAPRTLKWSFWYFVIFAITLCGVENGAQFIYFQF